MKARKEITLAIIIGLIFGLIVTGGILRARHALQNAGIKEASPSPLASGTVAAHGLTLTLETLDNQVRSEPTLTVNGKTAPEAYIVILGEAGEHIILPSELGNFTEEIKLVTGANTIVVTSYLEDGTKVEKTLTAVYTTAEI